MLTQEELKRVLRYDIDTGLFTRTVSTNGKIKVGETAGYLHPHGYIYIRVKNKRYYTHRLAWLYTYGEFPDKCVDHINGNRSDNRFTNLRLASKSENQFNRKKDKRCTSGFKGVSYVEKCDKWKAQAYAFGKHHYLGLFLTPEEAAHIYNEFTKILHGEFYRDTTIQASVA